MPSPTLQCSSQALSTRLASLARPLTHAPLLPLPPTPLPTTRSLPHLELVRVPGDQYVHIHLALQHRQCILVPPRHHLVAVAEPDAEVGKVQHL